MQPRDTVRAAGMTCVATTARARTCDPRYWRHHITLAYLAATEAAWQHRMAGLMLDKMTYFFKCSKGGTMIDEHHWMDQTSRHLGR